ncbi:hypothetical protein GUJ93_ZPchr0010g9671 [Zizania palustris]|uniref:Uncharacterized protein n=1 Tax=Zizania palustris TaxID=103762 RepID=A0A8J5W7Y9_ZIZPA|nr:hypothetical protein GUJ93_ZPchr0010g9671 [Zizania palustris]
MEMLMAAEPPRQKAEGLVRRLLRLLRRKHSTAGSASSVAYSVAGDEYDESIDNSINSVSKLKLSGNLAALDALFRNAAEKKGAPGPPAMDAADAHAFVASLLPACRR